MARATSGALRAGTRRAQLASRIYNVPPTSVATIGSPAAIASRMVSETPSLGDVFA